MMKIGLIGLGGFGGNAKIKAWKTVCAQGNHELYICESNKERLHEIGNKYQVDEKKRFLNFEDLLSNNSYWSNCESLINAVDITTSADTHFKIAMYALDRGKHVFVEKPSTENLKQAELLHDKVKETGLVLQVGVHFRYNKLTDKIKELIDNGELGKLYQIEGRHVAGKRPRLDGGAILSCGMHFIDLIMYLTDRKVIDVTAVSKNFLKRPEWPNEDLSYVHMNLEGNLLATVKSSVVDYATGIDAGVPGINADWDFVITGSKGMVYADYCTQKLVFDSGRHEWNEETQAWKWKTGERKEIPVLVENVYETELKAFLDHIKQGSKPRADVYSSGVLLQKIIDASYMSAETKMTQFFK